jgi:hypothetical protein
MVEDETQRNKRNRPFVVSPLLPLPTFLPVHLFPLVPKHRSRSREYEQRGSRTILESTRNKREILQRTRKLIHQTSIAWKPDGQHIAIGLFNKSIMTFYVGDLKRPVGVKGEDWKMD